MKGSLTKTEKGKPMTGIQLFWTVVFAIAVLCFLVVEVVVVIGGAGNIVDMVKSLLEHRSEVEKN